MKKIVLLVLMFLFLSKPLFAAGVNTLFEVDVYIGSPGCTVGTNDYLDSLVEVDLGCSVGILTQIKAYSDSSDDYTVYIFDMDIDDWATNTDRINDTKLIWDYASSTTSCRDDNPLSFDLDDLTNTTSAYIGTYNGDDSYTANFWMELSGECWRQPDSKILGTVTATE